jgi:hypothetical protein
VPGKWINSRGSELKDVSRIAGILLSVELPGVEGKEEKPQRVT